MSLEKIFVSDEGSGLPKEICCRYHRQLCLIYHISALLKKVRTIIITVQWIIRPKSLYHTQVIT